MKTRILCLGLALAASAVCAQLTVDLEAGYVVSGYNDVQIPNDLRGNRLSLTDDLSSDPAWAGRTLMTWRWQDRHALTALIAPLSVDASGTLDRDIRYDEVLFPAGTDVEASFRFDSYRLGYRRLLVDSPAFRLELGPTLKIRDAEIALEGGGQSASYDNTGVVPLIGFLARWQAPGRWALQAEGDALAAPQGRAEDILVAVHVRVRDDLNIKAGYRLLEGGADNDKVYTFSLFHYAVMGVAYTF